MSRVVTLRLPDEAVEAVRELARRERRSVNEIGTRIVEEWLRQQRFAHIEFRSFNGERHGLPPMRTVARLIPSASDQS